MTFWTVEVNETEDEPNLVDVEIEDTSNPFGNFAIAHIKDQDGERYDKYPKGTRVDFYYSEGILSDQPEDLILTETTDEYITLDGETDTFGTIYNEGTVYVEGDLVSSQITQVRRFTGFVVERREYEEMGTDMLEVECYSFDQFLRGSKVTTNTTGMTLFDALESIITNDTPITWNANNVSVGDPQTLTRNLRGESVETALRELAYKSENENFGVQQDLEFYFRPRETSQSPRDIDNSQVFGIDTPEEGREELYEVRVFFNGGDESVTVDRGDEKLDQQEALGLDTPPENVKEVTFEDITDIDDARDKGEQILQEREASQTGEVQTYGLEDTEPGDLITITYDAQDVDQEYVVAGINYQWQEDTTTVTIIKKTGYQDEVLLRIADNVEKVDLRPADRDAINNRVTETTIGVEIDVSGSADGNSYSEFRVTNTARNLARDAWTGSGNLDITEIAVGGDNSNLSRSNQSLENELTRVSATESLPDSKSVEYSANITQTGVSEVGLFDSSGNLITRAILETPVDIDGSVTVTLTVSNDSNINRGVITNSGQTSVRDTLADNSPNLPTQYAYGTGQTDPTEADASLENQVIAKSLTTSTVATVDNNTEWGNTVDTPDNQPIEIVNGELKTKQSCKPRDALNDSDNSDANFRDDDAYNNGQAAELGADGLFVEFNFSWPYTLQSDRVGIKIRSEILNTTSYEITWDGTVLDSIDGGGTEALGWNEFGPDGRYGGPGYAGAVGEDIQPDETHTLRVEATDTSALYVDCVALYDRGFSYNFANPDASTNSGGYLSGPELYPDEYQAVFDTVSTRRELDAATATQVWNDTSNSQYIELSNDGGSNWIRTNNSQTASANFASPSTSLDVRAGISRFGTQNAFPTNGINPQAIDTHELTANIEAITSDGIGAANTRAIVSPGELTGETLREAGALASDNTLLTRSVYAAFDVTSQMRIISSETQTWDNP